MSFHPFTVPIRAAPRELVECSESAPDVIVLDAVPRAGSVAKLGRCCSVFKPL